MNILYLEQEINEKKQIDEPEPKWYCGTWTWLNTRTGEKCQFYCGSARCPRQKCQTIFWNKRINRIGRSLAFLHHPPDQPARFFTLTYRQELPREDVWKDWWTAWNSFRYVIKRKYGYFSYIAILESHPESEYPHIHGLTNLWMKKKDWSERWTAVGGGPIGWIEVVKDKDVSIYFGKDRGIAKYFGKKNMINVHLKTRRRSIFASRDLTGWEAEKREEAKSEDWVLMQENLIEKDLLFTRNRDTLMKEA